jgi:hypothetical protein
MLSTDSCFRVKQSHAGSNHSIGLNAAALLDKGRQSTKAGILVQELPEPVDWIDDVHPVRPGMLSLTCSYVLMHAYVQSAGGDEHTMHSGSA